MLSSDDVMCSCTYRYKVESLCMVRPHSQWGTERDSSRDAFGMTPSSASAQAASVGDGMKLGVLVSTVVARCLARVDGVKVERRRFTAFATQVHEEPTSSRRFKAGQERRGRGPPSLARGRPTLRRDRCDGAAAKSRVSKTWIPPSTNSRLLLRTRRRLSALRSGTSMVGLSVRKSRARRGR